MCVEYGDVVALSDVSLDLEHGEVVALLGASGSGKSTLLSAIAGLVDPSEGEIWVDGRRVAAGRHSTPPDRRQVGVVFQSFALWPHLSVLDTVAYPLRRAGRSARAAEATANELLLRLGIGELARRRPAELSGGEQQRVGLARALARNARLYLLDEPTAHLDAHQRTAFQESVVARQLETGAAVVYATHDAAEALALADRVAILVSGRLIQIATPHAVYSQPVNVAAAVLTGSCALLDARVGVLPGGQLSVDFGAGAIRIGGGSAATYGGGTTPAARAGRLMVRPDWVHVGGPFTGRVTAIAFRGAHADYRLDTRAGSVLMSLPGPPSYRRGDTVAWGLSRAWLLDTDAAVEPADGTGLSPAP
ncbi:MAG: ABC transporter ATP-binding protein [Mycobacteriales bacterium]